MQLLFLPKWFVKTRIIQKLVHLLRFCYSFQFRFFCETFLKQIETYGFFVEVSKIRTDLLGDYQQCEKQF